MGEGSTNQCGTDMKRSVEGRGMGGVHRVNEMDTTGISVPYTTGTFRKESGNLKEVGLGWINGGKKDCFWMGEDERWWRTAILKTWREEWD